MSASFFTNSQTAGKNNIKLPVSHGISGELNGFLRKEQILVKTDASSLQYMLLRMCMVRRKDTENAERLIYEWGSLKYCLKKM